VGVKTASAFGWELSNKRVIKNITICFFLFVLFGVSNAFAVDAFPGAEGSGHLATGGRGGAVYEVNNLSNSGPGSIVDAVSQGNRTIVFRVSGTIPLDSVILEPKSNTTIAGQTAPGDGVCINDAGASFPTRDIIDARIVNDVINKTGHSIATTAEQPEGGWPPLDSVPAPTDSDHDGMPDLWETSHGLNPNDAGDRNGHTLDTDYTNLEVYLDWLVSSVRTDIVYDGIVNFSDFARFAEHWNSSAGSPLYDERYDFNRNDTISMDDLFYIAQDWLTSGQEY
jgi:hypothetical protein